MLHREKKLPYKQNYSPHKSFIQPNYTCIIEKVSEINFTHVVKTTDKKIYRIRILSMRAARGENFWLYNMSVSP